MRSTLVIGVVAAFGASAAPVLAQSFPTQAAITQPRVQVRSGPSDTLYPALELPQGATVIVLRACKEQPGWLEIRPPEGSFNWINAKLVKQVSPYDVVVLDQAAPVVPALVGSTFEIKPNKEAKHGYLPGAILRVVGQAHIDGGDTWLPVQPDSRDVRYIPASAVNLPSAPATITAPASWAIGSKATNPPPAVIPGYPTAVKPAASTTSLSPTPAAPSITPTSPAITNPAQWSTWGKLQTTTFRAKDGQPMFVLVDAQGQPLLYVTSRPGTNLAGYVNRTVCLYGPTVYRPDEAIRTPYMVASHVAVP